KAWRSSEEQRCVSVGYLDDGAAGPLHISAVVEVRNQQITGAQRPAFGEASGDKRHAIWVELSIFDGGRNQRKDRERLWEGVCEGSPNPDKRQHGTGARPRAKAFRCLSIKSC